jgi:hypothetical protein
MGNPSGKPRFLDLALVKVYDGRYFMRAAQTWQAPGKGENGG